MKHIWQNNLQRMYILFRIYSKFISSVQWWQCSIFSSLFGDASLITRKRFISLQLNSWFVVPFYPTFSYRHMVLWTYQITKIYFVVFQEKHEFLIFKFKKLSYNFLNIIDVGSIENNSNKSFPIIVFWTYT